MSGLRLLADDLTGALDAAAPFAAARTAFDVHWVDGDVPPEELPKWQQCDTAIASMTRSLSPSAAAGCVSRLAVGFARGRPAFKKIDSLLRGNTAAEIIAAHRAGGFARTLVTPAFPAQGRIVRDGRLFVTSAGREEAGPDIVSLLQGAGADAAITVCDAASDAELDALTAAHRGEASVLWAGSSGLARALSGRSTCAALRDAAVILVVTGSRHGVTRAQLELMDAAHGYAVVRDSGTMDAGLAGQITAGRLARGESVVLDASPPPMPEETAAARMRKGFATLAAAPPPGLLVVSGGDTLARLLAALDCRCLRIRGEVAAGLPLSVLSDGSWAGVHLISKSGAFDDGGMIGRLLASAVVES